MRTPGPAARLTAPALTALLALAGCQKPAPPALPSCRPPLARVTPHASAQQAAGDAMYNCVRTAAYDGVRGGEVVEAAAKEALSQCAGAEAAYFKIFASQRKVWPHDRKAVDDQLAAAAQLTAAQKRARGCGRPGGEPESLSTTSGR